MRWLVAGRIGESYREFDGQRFNPPRHIPWLQMDAETGRLSGTPRDAGVYPVAVAVWTMTGSDLRRNPGATAADARRIIVVVEE
jgi:hypothetical protein